MLLSEGIFGFYKPPGWTSFDAVACIRRFSGIKKVGHAGSLDPLAEGVLVIALGSYTKQLAQQVITDKEYIAQIQLGFSTETYDLETPLKNLSPLQITESQILKVLKSFEGEQWQTPPIYSAIKKDGMKLYQYARKHIQLEEIQKRQIQIHEIQLLSWQDSDYPYLTIRVRCSSGSYIRSLALDIGNALGAPAYLHHLLRTRVGCFRLENTLSLSEVKHAKYRDRNI